MSMFLGYLFSILAAAGFGAQPLIVSSIQDCGFSGTYISLLRTTLAIPVFFVIVLLKKGESFRVRAKPLLKIAVLAFTGSVLTTTLLFNSYSWIDTGIATALDFSYPLFVFIFSALISREKVTRGFLISLALCIAGISLFCNPGGSFSWKGFIMAFVSGITYGFYLYYLDKSNIMKEVGFYTFTFYFFVLSTVMLFPYVLATKDLPANMPAEGWRLLCLLAAEESLIVVLLQFGITIVGSRAASILGALEPVTSAVLGTCVLGEQLNAKTVIGIVLILAAAVILILAAEPNPEKETHTCSGR